MTKGRLPCLTGLRGIAALCVLLHHFTAYLLPTTGAACAEATCFLQRSYLWVDFFFVLSGFLLAYLYQDALACPTSLRPYLAFLRARLARTYPLHLVMLLAVLCLNVAMVAAEIRTTGLDAYLASPNFRNLRFYGHDTLGTFFQHLFLLNSMHSATHSSWNGPSWSIGAEWAAYLLFPILLLPAARLPRFTIACLPVSVCGVYAIERSFDGTLDVAGVFGTLRCLLEFWLGIGLFRLYRTQRASSLLQHDAFLLASLLGAIAVLHFDVPDTLAIVPFAALVLAGAQSRGSLARFLDSRPLLWLGEISYSVYMTHWVALGVALWLWKSLMGNELGSTFDLTLAFAALLAGVVLVLALSTLTWRLVEVPWRRRLRGREDSSPPGQSSVST